MESIVSLLTLKKATSYLITGTTLRNALEKFKAHKYSVVPLLDKEGHYLRTISEGDLLRCVTSNETFDIHDFERVLVDDVESYRPYRSLGIDASILEVIALSLEQNFIPVVDDKGVYIGIITRKEVIKYLSEKIEFKFND